MAARQINRSLITRLSNDETVHPTPRRTHASRGTGGRDDSGSLRGTRAGRGRPAGVLRRAARPHQLVLRRLHLRQPHHRSGGRLQLRQGSADQASAGLRHPDHHAARLDGGDRPLGICGRRAPGERSELVDQQTAHRPAACGPRAGRHPEDLPVAGRQHDRGQADRGPGQARHHRHRLEAEQRGRGRRQRARQVHRLLLVRVDLDAELPEHAPQCLLQGLRQGAGPALQRARQRDAVGPLGLDGSAARSRQRAPGDLAQRERVGRDHVSDRGRPPGPPDRPGMGRSRATATKS